MCVNFWVACMCMCVCVCVCVCTQDASASSTSGNAGEASTNSQSDAGSTTVVPRSSGRSDIDMMREELFEFNSTNRLPYHAGTEVHTNHPCFILFCRTPLPAHGNSARQQIMGQTSECASVSFVGW